MAAHPDRADNTAGPWRRKLRLNLSDRLSRRLDTGMRRGVEDRFDRIAGTHGRSAANRTLLVPRSIDRRRCVGHGGLRNPLSNNRPFGLEWPAGIDRPEPERGRRGFSSAPLSQCRDPARTG